MTRTLIPPAHEIDDDGTRRQFLAALAASGLLTGCTTTATELPPAGPPTVTVTTPHGPVEVPATPARPVLLDDTAVQAARAVGVAFVGAPAPEEVASFNRDAVLAATPVTESFEYNYEAIAAVSPDVVVGIDFGAEFYDLLAPVAPTVLVPFDTATAWQDAFRAMATSLGRGLAAEEVLRRYQQRADSLAARLGGAGPQVSVMRVSAADGNFRLDLRDLFNGLVLADAGVRRPANQDRDGGVQEISLELIGEADADVLFVYTAAGSATAEAEAEALAALAAGPLWANLRAVRTGSVHVVGDHWLGGGPIAAQLILDDLDRHLS